MSLAYKLMESPVGKLKLVASDKGLVAVLWENDSPRRVRLNEQIEDETNPVLVETERQLKEYGARHTSRNATGDGWHDEQKGRV